MYQAKYDIQTGGIFGKKFRLVEKTCSPQIYDARETVENIENYINRIFPRWVSIIYCLLFLDSLFYMLDEFVFRWRIIQSNQMYYLAYFAFTGFLVIILFGLLWKFNSDMEKCITELLQEWEKKQIGRSFEYIHSRSRYSSHHEIILTQNIKV
jgi:hypothetical protein